MEKLRFVGLDVHKDSVAIAVADADGGVPLAVATVPSGNAAVIKQLRKLGPAGSLRCCYEAGPTGLGLHRALEAAGISCIVAPSLVPHKTGDRVKTDSRDAAKLARFLRSGDLTAIHVHDEQTEAMRDLERARDDAKNAERVARHQLSKFLLRHGRACPQKTKTWSAKFMDWVRSQQFEQEAHNRVLPEYVRAVEEASARVERLTKDIVELVESWHLKPLVTALQAMRGIKVLTAVILAAEIGDMARFSTDRN